MREHLYRGKTTKKQLGGEFNEIWVEGDIVQSKDKMYIHPKANRFRVDGELSKIVVMHEVIPETIGEYTGLTDKNGKKIFEGDLIKAVTVDTHEERIAEVCIGEYADINSEDDLHIGVYLKCEDFIFSAGQLKQYEVNFEVIGNIHETLDKK